MSDPALPTSSSSTDPTSSPAGTATFAPAGRRRRENEKRGAIVIVMVASLLASALFRYISATQRDADISHQGEDAARTSLSSMNSYALGLLLGGLRGPLVMVLWVDSENKKTDKNLEGVDTQIEWIRLLQPEFDTVHIFQIWNKAYNISVQMANMANKYDVILGAMDYAHSVDRSKPDDINIVSAIGQLFFDKFGNSSEKYYYRKRVRQETMAPATEMERSKIAARDPNLPRVRLDPVLDAQGNVLPDLYRPAKDRARPDNLPADAEWDDGTEMQYLPKYAPYIDGVSPFGMAYNYYKRSEVLLNLQQQHHDQLSDMVVDSRPALSLKFWGEEEMEQGHRRELQALAIPMRETGNDDEIAEALLFPSASIAVDAPLKDPTLLPKVIAGYSHAVQLFSDAPKEYARHFKNFPERESQSQGYLEEMRAELSLVKGDLAYAQAMQASGDARTALLTAANEAYKNSRLVCYQILLKHYVESRFVTQAFPPGFGLVHTAEHKGIDDMNLEQAVKMMQDTDELRTRDGTKYVNTDRYEFDRFLHRATLRETAIAGILGTGAKP